MPSNVSMSTEEREKLKGATDEELLARIMQEAADNPVSPENSPKARRTMKVTAKVKKTNSSAK